MDALTQARTSDPCGKAVHTQLYSNYIPRGPRGVGKGKVKVLLA